jgi:hypothetical protein
LVTAVGEARDAFALAPLAQRLCRRHWRSALRL